MGFTNPPYATGIAGGTEFPPSPNERDCFYRTDLNEFYTYDGANWVPWRTRGHTIVVAASDSLDPTLADPAYRCDGAADEVEINAAIAALPAAGGSVVLLEGTYTIAAAILINRDDVMLVGSGHGTLIQVSANVNVIEVGDGASARTNVIIKDLQIDGSAVTGIVDIVHGIRFRGGAGALITRSRVEGCYVHGRFYDGIHLHYSEDCMVVRNRVESVRRDGIRILRSNRNQVALNDCYDCERGIEVYILSERNIIANNRCSSSDEDGIEVHQGHHNIVVGNYCEGNTDIGTERGIEVLDGSRYNLVIGNHCEANVTGIEVREHSDQNMVIGNYCEGNGTGIAVSKDVVGVLQSDDNCIVDNYLWDNPISFTDTGTNTKLATKIFQFIQGTTFISADISAKGWEIDAANEWAIALGQLPIALGRQFPIERRRVVRIKIWAVALVAETHKMRLNININAGASDEPYTTEAITVANKPSETSDFAIGDVIYWKIDQDDDIDIEHLASGDSLEIKVLHAAVGDHDCATDAVLRCVEIEYV